MRGNGKRFAAFMLIVLLILCSLPLPVAAETAKEDTDFLSFEKDEVVYFFGENDGICSTQQAVISNDEDIGNISYTLDENDYGIEICSDNGIVKICDYEKLYGHLKKGDVNVKIRALKEAYEEYEESNASYELKIRIKSAPEKSYHVSEPDGDNGWYRNGVKVSAEKGYVLKERVSDEGKNEIVFSEEGIREESFFVVNTLTGEIYRKESISLKKDIVPVHRNQILIKFPEKNISEKTGVKTGFFNDFVKAEIKVSKEAFENQSDIQSIRWKYGEYEGFITEFNETDGWYCADLNIMVNDHNLNDNLSFSVKDMAGNESSEFKSEEVLVFDNVSPVIDIQEEETGSKGDTDIYINVTEDNFHLEDVKIRVLRDNEEMESVNVTWGNTENVHTGKLCLNEDGKYDVYISYAGDPAGNKTVKVDGTSFEGYVNSSILIDKTVPVLRFDYGESEYFNDRISGKIYVKERNFASEDFIFRAVNEEGKVFIPEIVWESTGEEKYKGSFVLEDEGEYILSASYTDVKGNSDSITSPVLVIDKTEPEVNITLLNTDMRKEYGNRIYYDKNQNAEITVKEKHFSSDLVNFNIFCCDAEGKAIKYEKEAVWEHNGDIHTAHIDFEEGNYVFSVTCEDSSGNIASSDELAFTVDKTAPCDLKLTYSRSENNSNGIFYYKDNVKVTLSCDDYISGTDYFVLKFMNKETVLKPENGTGEVCMVIPEEFLKEGNRIRGSISFYAFDMAGNRSDVFCDGKILVVDNISPELKVTYEEPVNIHNGIKYYNSGTEALLNIKEENFFAEDINVTVNIDGRECYPHINWVKKGNEEYEARIEFKDDAHYILKVAYTDRSSNVMREYVSEEFAVDTGIQKPHISIKNLVPSVNFSDRNLESSEVILVFTDSNGEKRDVTSDFLKSKDTATAMFTGFPVKRKYDGIYILSAEMKDYAGNSSVDEIMFTVNHFGSVYSYGEYLRKLVEGDRVFVKKICKDIKVRELNPDNIKDEKIIVTRDGRAYDKVKWSMKKSSGGEHWNRNDYVISKDSFSEDGLYRISLFSSDAAGNSNENNQNNMRDISFTVDNTEPEIISIKGLEDEIVNATEQMVEYTAFDASGIEMVKVFVNDRQVFCEEEIEKTDFDGKFLVGERFGKQNIRIELTDVAGNVYSYMDSITVSTNAFARWLADKKSILLTIGTVTAGLAIAVMLKKLKN